MMGKLQEKARSTNRKESHIPILLFVFAYQINLPFKTSLDIYREKEINS